MNQKGPVFGSGPATIASFLIWPDGGQEAQKLAAVLGITLPNSSTSASINRMTTTTSLNLELLPQSVRDAVAELTDDRSADTMRIIGACCDASLTLAEARTVVGSRGDLAGRLANRNDDDVQTSWLKNVDSRQECQHVNGRAFMGSVREGASPTSHPRIQSARTTMTEDDAGSTRLRFPRLDLAALVSADRPPREWVVRGLIPAGASVSIVAAAGTGKSLLILAMSMAVARGEEEFAGYPISRRRRVLLVDMENTEDDLADRSTALGVSTVGADEFSDLILIHLPQLDGLDTKHGAEQLMAIVKAYQVSAGDVVVLDSLQRVISGRENDSDTMRDYYQQTGILLKRLGITVIRTDNTGKDNARGARGTSGKRDDVDIELILTRDPQEPAQMTLTPGKSRLPDIKVARLTRVVDDATGSLQYRGGGDPWAGRVAKAVEILNGLDVPPDIGERRPRKR